ncbi:MAG TPA: hypothetical protein VN791_04010 [Acidimicrobiales bacterium]|nr:hypothetical protein [Acidimicrobiales bacterium]
MPDPTSLTASPRHDAADVPPGVGAPPDGPDTLAIVPWPDPVIDTLGHDPRSWYVEQFWLPVIGPTSTWLLRRIVARFDAAPDGFDLNLDETARGLGLGGRDGRHSPFQRALARCVTFKLARPQGPGALGVRRRIPPLARRHLDRLPPTLQKMHDDWSTAQDRTGVLDEARRRSRRLALKLLDIGADRHAVELQLVRWRVHPAMAHEATEWALSLPASPATSS